MPGQDLVKSFSYQWTRFHDFRPEARQEFAGYLGLVDPSEVLVGRLVLDAGCGNGRFTREAAWVGAKQVVGVDLSESVCTAASNLRDVKNASVVNADLYRLPFSDERFDVIFSIGVIHHLPDPPTGVRELARTLKPGGEFFAWVYAREGNELFILLVEPLRRVISWLPFAVGRMISAVLSGILWGIITTVYAPLSRVRRGQRVLERLPLSSYLLYLHRLGFRATYVTTFDKLTPKVVSYPTQAEVRQWLEDAGLTGVMISLRNGNSWRARGCKPAVV